MCFGKLSGAGTLINASYTSRKSRPASFWGIMCEPFLEEGLLSTVVCDVSGKQVPKWSFRPAAWQRFRVWSHCMPSVLMF